MESYTSEAGTGLMDLGPGFVLFILAIGIVMGVCNWKIYTKAGKPGWAAIVPVYNCIVLVDIVAEPLWWFCLLLVPLVNVIFIVWVFHRLSLSFGYGVGMTLLLLLMVGFPVLAFGSSTYRRIPKKSEQK